MLHQTIAEHGMMATIAFMRLFILVAWFPFFLFYKNRPSLYVPVLVAMLLIPNLISVYIGLVGP